MVMVHFSSEPERLYFDLVKWERRSYRLFHRTTPSTMPGILVFPLTQYVPCLSSSRKTEQMMSVRSPSLNDSPLLVRVQERDRGDVIENEDK